ncbi:putative MoxY [Fusarium oxysporum f. sp. albedinis]|nr:putative MoxY [Fusarium oxysporum f. sp. albedinis]KAK2469299.1 hypothetical protein H9L39_19016 [Fusarium oxysporum f. sp. albedinis]
MNANHSSAGFSEPPQDPSKVLDEYKIPDVSFGSSRNVKAIYIGMGMSGIDFAYHAQKVPNLEVQLYEKNDAPGGTWLENQYPGCACDVPIATYQYRWALKPDWDHYYAHQPDILKYLQDVAEEHDLTRFCKFKHQVTSAEWLEDKGKWRVAVMEDNDPSKIRYDEAEFLINGTGILNSWKWPDIPGRDEFKGDMVHSARWDKNVDLKGKRIAVIGIGSSAIQVVPSVLEQAEKLYVFARSKTWITPGYASKYAGPDGTNLVYSDELKKRWRDDPTDYLRYVKSIELDLSGIWKMFLKEGSANAEATEFARHIMENKLNHRKDLIEGLVPTEFPFGCRRPTPGTGFLEALANPKTTLLKGGIKSFDTTGIIRENGEHVDADMICCCTGFDTTFRPRFPILVRGQNVQDAFDGVNQKPSYLGLTTPGVPNYFVSYAPNSPFLQGSASMGIEMQNHYFLKVIQKCQTELIKELSVKKEVGLEFTQHCDLYVNRGVWTGPCPSWYKGGIAHGKPAIWPGSRAHSLKAIEHVRFEDYDIKYIYQNRFAYLGNGFHEIESSNADVTWYYGLLDGKNEAPAWEE